MPGIHLFILVLFSDILCAYFILNHTYIPWTQYLSLTHHYPVSLIHSIHTSIAISVHCSSCITATSTWNCFRTVFVKLRQTMFHFMSYALRMLKMYSPCKSIYSSQRFHVIFLLIGEKRLDVVSLLHILIQRSVILVNKFSLILYLSVWKFTALAVSLSVRLSLLFPPPPPPPPPRPPSFW